MKKRSKKYEEALKKVDKKEYTKEEAVKLVKETSVVNFDASVTLAVRLNVDPKKADQQLRGAIVLPNGTGKTQKVLVIAAGEKAQEAKDAGADFVGEQEMLDKISNENWFDFDVIITTPDMMPKLGKLGKVLGTKGLMPNPKTGTVTTDIKKAVNDVKKGKALYKTDKAGNVHVLIGKVSFTEAQLLENLESIMTLLISLKASTVKGTYIKNISISSAMGPGIQIQSTAFDR